MNRRSPRRAANTWAIVLLAILVIALIGTLGYGWMVYDKASTERDTAAKDKAAAQTRSAELEKKLADALAAQPAPPTEDPAKFRKDLGDLRNKMGEIEREKDELAAKVGASDTKLADLQRKVDDEARKRGKAEADLGDLKTSSTRLEGQLTAAQTEAKKAADTMAELQKKVDAEQAAAKLAAEQLKVARAERDAEAEKARKAAQDEEKVAAELREMKRDPAMLVNPKAYRPEGSFFVTPVPGKEEQAQAFCKALGLEIVATAGASDSKYLLCKWNGQKPEALLPLLSRYPAVIKSVEPRDGARNSSGGAMAAPDGGAQAPGKGIGIALAKTVAVAMMWHLIPDLTKPKDPDIIHADAAAAHFDPTRPAKVVAIIDSGFDCTHPLLAPYIVGQERRTFIEMDGKKSPNDVSVTFKHAHILDITNEAEQIKEVLHGTHCAGVVASVAEAATAPRPDLKDNDIAPPRLRIMLLQAGYPKEVHQAIEYAVEHGANVISLSMSFKGGLSKPGRNEEMEKAIAKAVAKNVLVVCAADNYSLKFESSNVKNCRHPACYSHTVAFTGGEDGRKLDSSEVPPLLAKDSLLTVAAVAQGQLAGYSDYGEEFVQIAAPGGEVMRGILSAIPNLDKAQIAPSNLAKGPPGLRAPKGLRLEDAGFAELFGTSQATPMVAAAAALYWSQMPKVKGEDGQEREPTAEEVKKELLKRSRKSDALAERVQGARVLDIATLFAPPPTREINSPAPLPTFDPQRLGELKVDAFTRLGPACSLYWSGDAAGALREFLAITEAAPLLPLPHYMAALAAADLGQRDMATEQLRAGLKAEVASPVGGEEWGRWFTRLQGPRRHLLDTARRWYFNGGQRPDDSIWDAWPGGPVVPAPSRSINGWPLWPGTALARNP